MYRIFVHNCLKSVDGDFTNQWLQVAKIQQLFFKNKFSFHIIHHVLIRTAALPPRGYQASLQQSAHFLLTVCHAEVAKRDGKDCEERKEKQNATIIPKIIYELLGSSARKTYFCIRQLTNCNYNLITIKDQYYGR